MEIKPINEAGDCRTGTLTGLTKQQIDKALGFEPNVKDDPSKVRYSWGFTIDGERCGVWDYKGSHRDKVWSTFGPAKALSVVFGNFYESDQ